PTPPVPHSFPTRRSSDLTLAKTTEVPLARDGMYYKEFQTQMDWMHNGEGLTVFNLMGLANPDDPAFERRVRRYAGFYMNEDPGADQKSTRLNSSHLGISY